MNNSRLWRHIRHVTYCIIAFYIFVSLSIESSQKGLMQFSECCVHIVSISCGCFLMIYITLQQCRQQTKTTNCAIYLNAYIENATEIIENIHKTNIFNTPWQEITTIKKGKKTKYGRDRNYKINYTVYLGFKWKWNVWKRKAASKLGLLAGVKLGEQQPWALDGGGRC